MVIVNLKGGLGNQMFQYAAGRRLAEIHNTELKFDLSFLSNVAGQGDATKRHYELSIFNIKENIASPEEIERWKNFKNRAIRKLFPAYYANPYIKERHCQVDPNILTLENNRYLDGHWMSEQYFSDIEPVIRAEFTFREKVLKEGKAIESAINNANAVCIQVRRGDYVTNPQVARVHGTTSLNYFKDAARLIKEKVNNPVFFIFSDDIKWCMENFKDLHSVFFIEKELENSKATNSDYLQLMIQCKYFIISNSTFAWWAAWLSAFEDKIVIAPKNWFNDKNIVTKDVYPLSWLKI